MKRFKFVVCTLGFACMIFAGLLAALHGVGTDPALYHKLQMRENILDYAGVSEADLLRLDVALADCLRGEELDNIEVEVFGQMQMAFNERELIHMEDCRQLFMLLRRVLAISLIAGIILLVLGFNRQNVRLAACLAPGILLIPLGAFALWAASDFNAAFNFFHEVLFTNDLWLLNPRTDLLIRICPVDMFMAMGARIGIAAAACALAVPVLGVILSSVLKEKK